MIKFDKPLVSPSVPTFLDGNVERADVTDLYPWLEYQFRIIATNEYGSGEASIPSLKIKTWDAGKERILIPDTYCSQYRRGVLQNLTDLLSTQIQ